MLRGRFSPSFTVDIAMRKCGTKSKFLRIDLVLHILTCRSATHGFSTGDKN